MKLCIRQQLLQPVSTAWVSSLYLLVIGSLQLGLPAVLILPKKVTGDEAFRHIFRYGVSLFSDAKVMVSLHHTLCYLFANDQRCWVCPELYSQMYNTVYSSSGIPVLFQDVSLLFWRRLIRINWMSCLFPLCSHNYWSYESLEECYGETAKSCLIPCPHKGPSVSGKRGSLPNTLVGISPKQARSNELALNNILCRPPMMDSYISTLMKKILTV